MADILEYFRTHAQAPAVELLPLPSCPLDFIEQEVSPEFTLTPGDLLPLEEDWITTALRGVNKGERNNTAAKLVGYYLGRGDPESRVLETLRGWNLRNPEPLSDKELQTIVASIGRKEAQKRIREVAAQVSTQFEPEPKTDLSWEEQRQAALAGLGDLLGMPIANVRVSPGSEGLYEIVLSSDVSIMITVVEICSEKKFHDRVYAASLISPNPVPRGKNGVGGWRSVLRTLASWAERVDAGPEATLRGSVQEFLNNYLSSYRGLMCYERGKAIPPHVAFFIVNHEGIALYARLDVIWTEAKILLNISRRKLAGVLSNLGHVNQRLKWPGCDSMVWKIDLATLPVEIRAEIYKKWMSDGED
jgi:hypothetical protein